ncbi:MAG: YraN family protein [Armatimonadetes bacterium CG2_30_59_28]|nr:YraN family protein [Armatimonadota bacterium]OIO92282.1 MAG: YraN family protein [Armatimonadetes bacterium CG2_30_59_28]PIU65314.1 MAG: YraN family protein [Armatimonadetes bacterium CG07_land_8_20_14_0_80_59_28]PIX42698.1 MAG: YraN family protein [Armatimonadetes bacterium CG_4_8_14_3_um_filter_58_9]PIY40668.1 MAG: YraN family protein [Armatimonadetes bacterium CG_4_10_14_3_um_filter_59_10]PJB62839.1 MAG: YraN family protein [Armatimonadetes bacterium CG_4_9_14_3_um_filter_58_7]
MTGSENGAQTSARKSGEFGEDVAERYLVSEGYTILERNFGTRYGEIDLIAEEKGVLVFVEVKARRSEEFGLPGDAVDRHKQRQISKMAVAYVCDNGIRDRDCRFDIVEIHLGEGKRVLSVNLIRDAFDLAHRPFV